MPTRGFNVDQAINEAQQAAMELARGQAQANETFAQMMQDFASRDVVNYVPNAPQMKYEPGFLAKLGAGLSGEGGRIQENYRRTAEMNAKMRSTYDQISTTQEGYRRLRMQKIQEAIADAQAKAQAILGGARSQAVQAGLDAGKDAAAIQSSQAQTRLARERGAREAAAFRQEAAKEEPQVSFNEWLGQDTNGQLYNNYQLALSQGQAFSDFEFNEQTSTWRPVGAKPLDTAEDVERMVSTMEHMLKTYPGPDEVREQMRASLENIKSEALASFENEASDIKGLSQQQQQELETLRAQHSVTPERELRDMPNAGFLNRFAEFQGVAEFTGEDITFDEDMVQRLDETLKQEAESLDMRYQLNQISPEEYVRAKVPLTLTKEIKDLANRKKPPVGRLTEKVMKALQVGLTDDDLTAIGVSDAVLTAARKRAGLLLERGSRINPNAMSAADQPPFIGKF